MEVFDLDSAFSGLYRDVIDNMDLAIAIYRATENGDDFIFVDINSHVEEIEQVKKEDIIGSKVTDVFPGVEEFGLLDVFKRVYLTGEPENHPISMYTDNRISGWRENYVYKLDSGEVVAVYKDETERKKMEEDLRRSWDEKNVIIEGAADPIVVSNEETVLFLNNKAVELFGFNESQEVVGTPFLGLFSEEVQDVLKNRVGRRLRGEKVPVQYESVILRADGRRVPVEFHISVIEYDGVPAVLNVIRDISGRKQAEDALRERETLFREFMQSATDGFTLLDENMRYVEVNDSWLQIIGLERVDVIGKHILELFPNLKETGRYDAFIDVFETGEPVEYQAIESASGPGLFLDVSAFKAGDFFGLVVKDVSDRVKYQRRLETLHGHAASLASADTLDHVATITRDYLAQMGYDIGGLGFVEGDMLAHRHLWGAEPSSDPIRPLDGPGITVEAVNTGKTLNIGDVRDNPLFIDGFADSNILSELAVPVMVAGKAVGIINLESEVGDAFSENDQRLVETLASHIAAAFTNIRYNERLSAIHSFSYELEYADSVDQVAEITLRIISESLGYSYSAFNIIQETELVAVAANGKKLLGMRMPLTGKGLSVKAVNEERTIIVGDLRSDPFFIRGSLDSLSEIDVPIILENEVFGTLNVESMELDAFSDEDARLLEVLAQNVASALYRIRSAEDKLELERQVLAEQVRVEQEQEMSLLKTRFIITATHELRTPVTSILGYLELILDDTNREIPANIRKDLNVVVRNANRLASFTNDLLDIQRITSGRFEVQLQKTDIVNTINDVVKELTPMYNEKHQVLLVKAPTELSVNVNEIRISQLLINLLRNANKFTPAKGQVTVTLEPGDGHVLISVKDTGVGLSEEDIGKLFAPFPGIRHTLSVTSTGLGLAICKGIVDMHKGDIWAESDGHGEGSTFYVKIPI